MDCDGSCCVAFPIGGAGTTLDFVRNSRVRDGDLLGFMLRQLTHDEAVERRQRFGVKLPVYPDTVYYRCIYWDESTRLCTAYRDRPEMCSDYPYPLNGGRGFESEGTCEHGCDCQGAPLVTLGEN